MRPEGFRNPYPDVSPFTAETRARMLAYEAGAEAMLEGLLKSNEPDCEVYVTSVGMKAYGKSYPGKWVFIPEE